MADGDKLEIIIDRDECIGDGACCSDAPGTFEMDDENIAILKTPWTDDREAILEAARNCPTEAITVKDTATGEQLFPED